MNTYALIANARRIAAFYARLEACRKQKEVLAVMDDACTIEELGDCLSVSAYIARAAREKKERRRKNQ